LQKFGKEDEFKPGSVKIPADVVEEIDLDLFTPLVLLSVLVSTKYFTINFVTAYNTTTKTSKNCLLQCT
jgi:hypothetical protein